MGNQTPDKPLAEMTVKELREIAREVPGITGVSSMKKDELLAALGGAAPEKKAQPKTASAKKTKTAGPSIKTFSRPQLKEKISQLHGQKKAAQESKDKSLASILRRKINRLKKQTRKPAPAAK